MPKQRKTCRVCGASYEACRSVKSGDGTFNWREVACSPECGMIYLQRVMESRGIAPVGTESNTAAQNEPTPVVEQNTSRRKKRISNEDQELVESRETNLADEE